MITDGQMAALSEVARSAAEDEASYATNAGQTWDDRRVGRMLARDTTIASLLPAELKRAISVLRQLDPALHAELAMVEAGLELRT